MSVLFTVFTLDVKSSYDDFNGSSVKMANLMEEEVKCIIISTVEEYFWRKYSFQGVPTEGGITGTNWDENSKRWGLKKVPSVG